VKDQIGSYFYFPTLLLQKAAGGYGAIRIYPPELVPVPFPKPDEEYDILIGDWFYLDHTVCFFDKLPYYHQTYIPILSFLYIKKLIL